MKSAIFSIVIFIFCLNFFDLAFAEEVIDGKEKTIWQQLDDLNLGNVSQDLEKALRENDSRFAALEIGSFACYAEVPGVQDQAKIKASGVKFIVHLCGDNITSELQKKQMLLTDDARKYAEAYNLLLLKQTQSKLLNKDYYDI